MRRVGVQRAQGAVVAGAHGSDHRDEFVAADLTADDPPGVHPQRVDDKGGQRHLAGSFGIGIAGLHADDLMVTVGKAVEGQLVLLLHHYHPFVRVELVGKGPHQGGLAGVDAAGDHDVLAGAHGGSQERQQPRVDASQGLQFLKPDVGQPVPADAQTRARGHGHPCAEPRSVGQPQVEQWSCRGELSRALAQIGSERLNDLDQLAVGVRDRGSANEPAAGVGDPHLVAPVDVDVFDLRVADPPLQPPEAEQRREHGGGRGVFLRRCRRRLVVADPLGHPLGDSFVDQRAGEHCPVLGGHVGLAPAAQGNELFRERFGDLPAQPPDHAVVDLDRAVDHLQDLPV